MKKARAKARDIRFFSEKNGRMVCVHDRMARDYAKHLEEAEWAETYEAGKVLDRQKYINISKAGIRKQYFDTEWASDFFIQCADGSWEVHELAREEDLKSRAEVEKLEFSRRYWNSFNIRRWCVVLIKGGEK